MDLNKIEKLALMAKDGDKKVKEEQQLIQHVFYKKSSLKQYSDCINIPYSRAVRLKNSALKKLKGMLNPQDYLM
ncbi:MAG: hypothetical protein ABRQ25_16685 [Clostridiaceae bacterium]